MKQYLSKPLKNESNKVDVLSFYCPFRVCANLRNENDDSFHVSGKM